MVKGQLTLPMEEVKKSNAFIRSKLKLDDVVTARIFTSIIACIKPADRDFLNYSIPAQAILPEGSGGKEYTQIKNALKSITGHVVEMPLSDEPNSDFAVYPLFSGARYEKGVITAQVHPDLKPHFIGLAKLFTTYNRTDFLVLSTSYAQRMFEILCSYEKTFPSVAIPLKELHRMLNTTPSLEQDFAQFRRRILEPTQKEITQKTRLTYQWKTVKTGRAVTAVEFTFSEKKKEEKEKKAQLNKVEKMQKYMKPAIACAKETHPIFTEGKCPNEKLRTFKCRMCKDMGYFLN